MRSVIEKENKRQFVNLKDEYREKKFYSFLKRSFDVFFSMIAIIVSSPVMLILAIIIKLDGGPAIYKQVSVGKNGKKFVIYKFRSIAF